MMGNGHRGHGTENSKWPWAEDGWTQRIDGIEAILEESISIAKNIEEERKNALGRSGDYGLLPQTYQDGELGDFLKELFAKDSELERIQLCLGMLEGMQGFLEQVKTDLTNLLANSDLGVFSKGFIYSQLLSRISTDINIAQQALFQRRLGSSGNTASTGKQITHQGYVLQVASLITSAALSRVRMSGLVPLLVMPLTYLQDRIDIRLIPYYDVAILSIPYGAMNSTCDRLATDYLAIPHEIGHYMYWWGEFVPGHGTGARPIRDFLEAGTENEPEWVKTWLEEMFADAVGCLIAGPVSVLGFQELLTSSSPYELLKHFHNDHAHPFPSLRPFIQSAILRKLNRFDSAADKLDENWQRWVAENWPGLQNPLQQIYLVGERNLLRGDEIVAHLSREGGPLDQILNTLVSLWPVHEIRCWTGDDDLETMYETFISGKFMEKVEIESADLPEISMSSFIRGQRMAQENDRKLSLREFFAGWDTEGPNSGDGGI
jgi:hypothetical protein